MNSTKQVDDKRLRIDIAAIKQTLLMNLVAAYHVPGSKMLADCLTKRGASPATLLEALSTGGIPRGFFFKG